MKELGYSPITREFRGKKSDLIMVSGRQIMFNSYYIHDYYPIKHFNHDVDQDIESVRKLIYSFKDGYASSKVAELIADAIRTSSIGLTNACLVVIPAHDTQRTISRYFQFCNLVCNSLNIRNRFNAITTVDHETTKGRRDGNKIEYFTFNDSEYRWKNVLLFDDVRTSGTTYKQTLQKIMETGANNVTGIFLAKTVSYLNA